MSEKRDKPNGFYGHWAKHLIENEGVEEVDDIDELGEDLDDVKEYDFGVYEDDQEETE